MGKLWRYDGPCVRCGSNKWEMSFVGGDWWCRSCLWAEFWNEDLALNYVIIHRDDFCERYPEGENALHRFLMTGEEREDNFIEEFISENLEDYADWCMTNPVITKKEELKGSAGNGRYDCQE